MYAENYDVKNIGICVFNSNWIRTCFGKPALEGEQLLPLCAECMFSDDHAMWTASHYCACVTALKANPVICSGSTLGSYLAVNHYVRTMLTYMDSVKCWLKGIESDQGYQNYLFYNGMFNTAMGNATLYMQVSAVSSSAVRWGRCLMECRC